MAIDLDKLAAELTASGYEIGMAKTSVSVYGPVAACIWQSGQAQFGGKYIDWTLMDIIRRHVAPVAPDPALREAIAVALWDVRSADDETWEEAKQSFWYTSADAVLSVLAERGIR